MATRAFDVRRPRGLYITAPHTVHAYKEDTIFYGENDPVTVDEVRRSLIDHDGYPSDIIVTERKNA